MFTTQKEIKNFLNKVCFDDGEEYEEGNRMWSRTKNGEYNTRVDIDMENMGISEIPIKFKKCKKYFSCGHNNLTTLKNCPDWVGGEFFINNNNLENLDYFPQHIGSKIYLQGNNLTEYFKNIKEEDFKFWHKLDWESTLQDYPFLINIAKKYTRITKLNNIIEKYPQTKLYLI